MASSPTILYTNNKHTPTPDQLNGLMQKAGWAIPENWEIARPSDSCEIITAWEGDHCVGMATLFIKKWSSGNLGNVCVYPDFEGRGIAGELSARVVQIAKDRGCLEVTSDTDNPRMVKILLKLQFGEFSQVGGKTFYRKNLGTLNPSLEN